MFTIHLYLYLYFPKVLLKKSYILGKHIFLYLYSYLFYFYSLYIPVNPNSVKQA